MFQTQHTDLGSRRRGNNEEQVIRHQSFNEGFLISVSKSLQKVEDEDMWLNTFSLGSTLRNGDRTENRGATPLLKHYKTEDSSFLDEEEDRNPKFFVSFQFYMLGLIVKWKFSL
nr:pro-MCH [Dromaius novaehollandiae]